MALAFARTSERDFQPTRGRHNSPHPVSPANERMIPAANCPCGGSCPRCESRQGVQAKLKVSVPGDALEQEADRIAEQITQAPHRSSELRPGLDSHNSDMRVQRKCAGCTAGAPCSQCEDAAAGVVQTKKTGSISETGPSVPDNLLGGLGGGQSLPASVQEEFGPRLGHDLGGVRIHTGAAADVATSAVGARAFTIGSDLVFAAGEFSPGTGEGRRLLAHELVHWVQQGGRADRIQRALKINIPASDPGVRKTAVAQMTPLLQKLCPDFEVAKSGDVTAKKDSECGKGEYGNVAVSTKHKLGCCCLCTLTRAPEKWTLVVSIERAPTTQLSTRVVRMTPTTGASVPQIRSWTGGPTESLVVLPPEETLGHELCGHAALHQAQGHPPGEDSKTSRTFSDIHDPTVKIQNVLAGKDELGLGSTPRGLAGSGTHRGESLRVFVVTPFTTDDATLSTSALAAIDGAAEFADKNPRTLIDIIGFRNAGDAVKGIAKTRADAVSKALAARMKERDDVDFAISKGASLTKIARFQPTVDGGLGVAPMVQIRLAREPAGLVNLPSGVTLPATPEHVGPENPKAVEPVLKGKKGRNACHDLLITTGWK